MANMMNETVRIRNLEIKNRLAVPPMVCFYWTDDNGYVTDKNIRHYKELAQGGFGLIIVEATGISRKGRLHETELGIWDDSHIEGLSKIADAIHEGGAKAFIQLVHAGGNGVGPKQDAPSTMEYWKGSMGYEMDQAAIERVKMEFAEAAVRAQKAGFDGVELHGCHGYLISCFFNSRKNLRTDAYGTNKSLFAIEVLKEVRKAVSDDFIVGIRLGAFEPVLEDGLEHARAISEYTDFMDVSYGGDCDGYAPEGFKCSEAVYGASKIKEMLPDMPVFGVHKINSRQDVINALDAGIDMVDIGKASLVDPSFANHVLNGVEEGHCLNCNNYCRWNPGEMANPNLKCPGYEKYNRS